MSASTKPFGVLGVYSAGDAQVDEIATMAATMDRAQRIDPRRSERRRRSRPSLMSAPTAPSTMVHSTEMFLPASHDESSQSSDDGAGDTHLDD